MAIYEERFKRNGVPVPVQYILMSQGARRRVGLHYHEYAELLFGVSGSATVYIGSECMELSAGSMIIVYNGEPHDVIYASGECRYHVVKFLPQILITGEQTYSEYSYVLALMEHIPNRRRLFAAEELAGSEVPRLFEAVREEWYAQCFGYELSLRADVTRIFLYILRKWREETLATAEPALLSGQKKLIQAAIEYIRRNYVYLTEEETAQACGVSAPYLSRCFKRAMHISFSAYVNSVRLREAEHLLLTTDASVTEIAQQAGFSTSAYFIACFRAARGDTPHRYRKLYRGKEA